MNVKAPTWKSPSRPSRKADLSGTVIRKCAHYPPEIRTQKINRILPQGLRLSVCEARINRITDTCGRKGRCGQHLIAEERRSKLGIH